MRLRILPTSETFMWTNFVQRPQKKTIPCEGPDCPMCKGGSEVHKKTTVTMLQYKQVKFPRSKKKRIQKKWRKNKANWAYSDPILWDVPSKVARMIAEVRKV